jgi:hypothetical protein
MCSIKTALWLFTSSLDGKHCSTFGPTWSRCANKKQSYIRVERWESKAVPWHRQGALTTGAEELKLIFTQSPQAFPCCLCHSWWHNLPCSDDQADCGPFTDFLCSLKADSSWPYTSVGKELVLHQTFVLTHQNNGETDLCPTEVRRVFLVVNCRRKASSGLSCLWKHNFLRDLNSLETDFSLNLKYWPA